jgi:hypothetical protein
MAFKIAICLHAKYLFSLGKNCEHFGNIYAYIVTQRNYFTFIQKEKKRHISRRRHCFITSTEKLLPFHKNGLNLQPLVCSGRCQKVKGIFQRKLNDF